MAIPEVIHGCTNSRNISSKVEVGDPLTPPRTDEESFSASVAEEVTNRCRRDKDGGLPSENFARYNVSPSDYKEFQTILQSDPQLKGYVRDKVRIDYDPTTQQLGIRMPTPIHECFSSFVADEIQTRLKDIAKQRGDPGRFADDIKKGASSRILLQEVGVEGPPPLGNFSQRHPDAQFQHVEAAYPGLVLEISYSQDGKNLKKLAEEYIYKSNGDIKAVIGINIEYRLKGSTVSLWRSEIIEEGGQDYLQMKADIYQKSFRCPDGSLANEIDEISLNLGDLATDSLSQNFKDITFSISFKRLGELLALAERMQLRREATNEKRGMETPRRLPKRKLPSSSPEVLKVEDEEDFQRKETRIGERAEIEDCDYEPPISRRKIS